MDKKKENIKNMKKRNVKVLKEYIEFFCGRLRHVKEVDILPYACDMEDDVLYRTKSKYKKHE